MKIEILPATRSTALAILSMTNLDNRELNPAIEKQLTVQNIAVAQPQSALADLLQLIGHRHLVNITAWDMNALAVDTVRVHATDTVTLSTLAGDALVPNLNAKSSRVLIVIGGKNASGEVVHATGQELQRKIKAFFGIQARLQFRTCNQETQRLETTRPDASA